MEHAFVQSMTRALCAGGVLVYIIPQRRLEVSARFLASHYASLAAYRFPDPEFAAFRQIVLFGAKKPHAKNDPAMVHRLAEWGANEHLEPLPDAPGPWDPLYRLPAVPRAPLLFAGLIFDPVEAAAEARRAGAWAAQPLAERLWPAQARATKPLLPLRRGHLAQLIAAGFLNNVVLRHGGRRVLVKGRVRKELVTIVDDDEQTIEREYLRTSLTMLDLDSGEIERIHSGTAPAGEDDASRRAA